MNDNSKPISTSNNITDTMGTSLTLTMQQKEMIAFLRVLAMLGVLFVHINGSIYLRVFGEIAGYGADGVRAFFMLSGLLVMQSYAKSKSKKEYWRKRIARTFPIYYFLLAAMCIFQFEWITADPFAIPRAFFMLEYIAPPTVSYNYCSMNLIGVLTIFMMFYIAVPILQKYIKSLETSFVAFWLSLLLGVAVRNAMLLAYGGFCDIDAVNAMSRYLTTSFQFFAAGVMLYFGLKEGKIGQMMCYFIFILAANLRYSFLHSDGDIYLILILAVIICYPIRLGKSAKIFTFLNQYTMGVFVSQFLCYKLADRIAGILGLNILVKLGLYIMLPCIAAVFLYHFVEVPGAKLINRLMADKKKIA